MRSTIPLRAPFPYFGGKSTVAELVWARLGAVRNYVEPFAGSLAVLLARPEPAGIELVGDADHMVANFWRAVRADPDAVARWADSPPVEIDLKARRRWFLGSAEAEEVRRLIPEDPEYFNPKAAGWWVWGLGLAYGSGWVRGKNPTMRLGIVNGLASMGKRDRIPEVLAELAGRLRHVQVKCGDWSRCLGNPTAERGLHGASLSGVFLDPPYGVKAERAPHLYGTDSLDVADLVREWAIAHGENPRLRIALCGYEGEHAMPPSWTCVPWKAQGGFGNLGRGGNPNRTRERIWFSPHCLDAPAYEMPQVLAA